MRTASDVLVVSRIDEVRAAVATARGAGSMVGFVPTMGALHEGHLSLIRNARRQAAFIVVSAFVNPLQFGPSEDFHRYPRDPVGDHAQAAEAGADLLFTPTVSEMYPPHRAISVHPGPLAAVWEGAVRPGHFAGVLTAVATLLHIVAPDIAVFGQKDFQQAALVASLVHDLRYPVKLVIAPTVREPDGLAMSSRNAFLGPEGRRQAPRLYRALCAVQRAFRDGERDARALRRSGLRELSADPTILVDYLAVVAPGDLAVVTRAEPGSVVLLAARVGGTRLIDNVVLTA